ncbi:metal tolerance protein 9 [Arachis duranensis]|uniref:Metal tolerance protein 9 n=1 Tax=Arachis duranensis TaxID=130453 RepID=A0A6P4B1I3_ARADU|nr:metal tolerance protein 9 [Arachis duranensis]XP_057725414.1 metal tolerance protein 9-like [Arachis stenosperma]
MASQSSSPPSGIAESDGGSRGRTEPLLVSQEDERSGSWRLNVKEFSLKNNHEHNRNGGSNNLNHRTFTFLRRPRKQRKVAEYYKKQERLLEGFNEMDTMAETGFFPGSLTEEEMKQLAKSERMAVYVSNACNLLLFAAKVFASVESKSLAVIASTMDSLLDLLSGFILWFTANAMKTPNRFHYPIGKKRMQPVGIIVFASVMATLGLQILIESGRELITKTKPEMDPVKLNWMIGIMVSVTVVKFILMVYCRRFKNEIVRAYAQDHFFDVITNSVGLAAAVLAVKFYWWLDSTGAIVIALYTINTWTRTVIENVWSLIGRTAPPDFLAKLTYLIWNHHEQIKHIDTVRAYTFGAHYFVEVDIVLPEDMLLNQAHNIGETLQEKLEQLPEVERAFVHIDFEFTHRPEHKIMV